jgi:hypothetical protein
MKGFELLLQHKHHVGYAFLYMLIPIIGYTLMYMLLTIGNGAPSVFTPWLNIPKESYYSINRYLLAPSLVLCWFTATAFIQVASRTANGIGTFEQTLAVLGLSISVAMWGGLLHDLPMSFLSAIKVIDARQHELDMNSPTIWRTLLWTFYSLYFIAFFTLFINAVRYVHKISLTLSILIGTGGFLIFQLIFVIFNR